MDIATTLVLIAILILVVAFIARPFLSAGDDEQDRRADRRAMPVLRERADLLAERNRVYSTLRDLDFDYQTHKVSDEDYAAQRRALVVEGVEILQELDALPALDETPEDDPIEAAVLAMRSGDAPPAPAQAAAPSVKRGAKAGSFCPNCGKKVKPKDMFCGSCGARL